MCLMKVGKADVTKMEQALKYLSNAQEGESKEKRFEKAVDRCTESLRSMSLCIFLFGEMLISKCWRESMQFILESSNGEMIRIETH